MQKYKSNITTTSGAALRNVPVEVIAENGTQAVLFLDREGTVPAANPLRTGADGTFYFYAVNGRYSLQTTVEGVTITDRDVVLLMDPEEITVAGPIAEAVAAAEAAATRAEEAVEDSGIPELVEAVQNAVVDVNTSADIAATKAGEAAASAGAAQGYSDTTLGYRNEANASKIAAAGSAAAAATSATNAGNSATAAAASAASIAGGPVASWAGLTGIITESQAWATVRSAVLTGLSTATATAVAATDSVLVMAGKLQAQVSAKLNLSGGVMTGDLSLNSPGSSNLRINRNFSGYASVTGTTGGLNSWSVDLGNAANDFSVNAFSDTGVYTYTPVTVERVAGSVVLRTPTAIYAFANANAYKAGGGSWADISDERTKQNIAPWAAGLREVLALNVRRWNFREETGRDVRQEFVGLIAQEAELVAPRLVSSHKGELGSLKFDDLRSVDPSDLVYMLVNGMQEQQRTIDDLRSRITALEA